MEGMGGGDPKLVAAIGAWLGWQALPLMLLLASLAGIGWAVAAQRKGDPPLAEQRVPFGVFACAAAFAAVPLRSEEHTSELQSLMRSSYAVFCLKDKNNRQ